ncbi:MAG: hypothetical protein JWR83_2760 [Aeromicrobium sp.]|nr:hypothetical protein [Aeromicrobium sp.]
MVRDYLDWSSVDGDPWRLHLYRSEAWATSAGLCG